MLQLGFIWESDLNFPCKGNESMGGGGGGEDENRVGREVKREGKERERGEGKRRWGWGGE